MSDDGDEMGTESTSVKALKKHGNEPLTIADLGALEKEFVGASDRALVILWASMVDEQIRRAIPKRMRQDISKTMLDKVIGDKGPFTTFSSKILVGYAFGVFGRVTYHDLEIIRALRNQFAHSRKPLSFDTPEVRKACETLQIPDMDAFKVPPGIVTPPRKGYRDIDRKKPQIRFAVACHTINLHLYEVYERPLPEPGRAAQLLP
jgi:DNA-binding MltR family transcriptional regulator